MKTVGADLKDALTRLRNQPDFAHLVRWVRESRDELRQRVETPVTHPPRDFLCGGMAELSDLLGHIDERRSG